MVSVAVRLKNVFPSAVRGGPLGMGVVKVKVPLPSEGVVANAGWATSSAATSGATQATHRARERCPRRKALFILPSPPRDLRTGKELRPNDPRVARRVKRIKRASQPASRAGDRRIRLIAAPRRRPSGKDRSARIRSNVVGAPRRQRDRAG